jgi:hypothetical protein
VPILTGAADKSASRANVQLAVRQARDEGAVRSTATCLREAGQGQGSVSSAGKQLPLGTRSRAGLLVDLAIGEVAFGSDVVVERGMDGCESLWRFHPPETDHRPLASSEGQGAHDHPVVGRAADRLPCAIAELVHRSVIGTQPIGGDGINRAVTLERFFNDGEGRLLVSGLGNETPENLAFLIDGSPQVVHLATDSSGHLF